MNTEETTTTTEAPTTTTTVVGHPPTAAVTVTCDTLTVDPQPTWGVRFVGTVAGHPFDLEGVYVGHHQSASYFHPFTWETGPIHVHGAPVWTLPPNPYGVTSGVGTPFDVTLTCHQAPAPKKHHQAAPVPAQAVLIPPAAVTSTTVAPKPVLPHTGADTVPLGGAGLALLAVGVAIVLRTRRLIEWG